MREDEGVRQRQCIICLTSDEEEYTTMEPCHMPIHKSCFVALVTSALGGSALPTCPCTHTRARADKPHDILPTSGLMDLLPPDLKQRWDWLRVRRQTTDLMRTCPHCRNGTMIKPGAKVWFCQNPACLSTPAYGFCCRCSDAVEDPAAHRCSTPMEDDAFVQYMKQNGVHPCPRCQHAAVKTHVAMCNHMTCLCGCRYCGVCGHEFTQVDDEGVMVYRHECQQSNQFVITDTSHDHIGNVVRQRLQNAL